MKGYIFNSLLVAGGSILGLLSGKKVGENIKDAVFTVLGLVTAFVGINMSMNGGEIIPVVFCLVLGTLAGSALRLEDRVNSGSDRDEPLLLLREIRYGGFSDREHALLRRLHDHHRFPQRRAL